MAIIIELTQLSPTMEEGTFVKWSKKTGDHVEPGDVLAEVETDKAVMEMEAFDDGILLVQLAQEGDKLPVGAPVGIVGDVGEVVQDLIEEAKAKLEQMKAGGGAPPAQASPPAAEPAQTEAPAAPVAEAPAPASTPAPAPTAATPAPMQSAPTGDDPNFKRTGRILASPLARRLAEDKGVDLARVQGSGPKGRIVKKDVLASIQGAKGGAVIQRRPDQRVEVSGMRKVIASRLHDAKNNIPHFYLTLEFDARPLVDLRKQLNADLAEADPEHPLKISMNDLIVKAAAMALTKHPICNSSWRDDHIIQHGRVDVGIAVAIDGGLITPYIRDADQLSIANISSRTRELAGKARDRKLKPEEYTDGTFTISNLGMFGISNFSAIINEPEAGLLAVGGLVEKPVVKNGELVPGITMTVTMSCDHRVIDGAEGAKYLQTFKNLIEHPHTLLIH